MTFFKSILLSFSMFSAIPVPSVEWNEKNMRYMMCGFPFVGVVIAVLCAAWFVFGLQISFVWQKNVSNYIFALVFTLIPVLISGGIHLDGFMDTCDALGSHASREKKLEILKDSHSGAFAVLGCVLYFLAFYVFSVEFYAFFYGADSSHRFVNIFSRFWFSIPVLSIFVYSRLFSALAVSVFPIAKDSGLVHTFATNSSRIFTAIWCEFFIFVLSLALIFLYGRAGAVPAFSSLAVFVLYYFMAKRNFGGITGDTAGWFVQMSEIIGFAAFILEKALD